MAELWELSGTRKSLHVTYVTTYGLKKNSYAKNIQSEVILDDLFRRSRVEHTAVCLQSLTSVS